MTPVLGEYLPTSLSVAIDVLIVPLVVIVPPDINPLVATDVTVPVGIAGNG
jgi:hypothetical protein